MATTTNYGWTTPDDTALVKDGASAIRTLGSSVDTTTKNLNPETTLGDLSFRSSTSNVNTRIPIGSSGQHLTVVAGVPAWATASDQTPLTTKGDLLGFSTLDARIPIGANGTLLTADSTETLGLKWAAPASGSTAAGCSLTKSAAQTLSNATATAITFNGENFDTDAYHDNSTNNSRITIPAGKGGKYVVSARATFASNITDQRRIQLRVNGSATAIDLFNTSTGVAGEPFTMQTIRFLSLSAGDYVEMFAFQQSGGNLDLGGDLTVGDGGTFFGAMYLGA